MAHSLSSVSTSASASASARGRATLSCSTRFSSTRSSCTCLRQSSRSNACTEAPPDNHLVSRRNAALILTGAMLGLNVAERSAVAAARRPPPPPPQEKKDPNLSGVQAKVLASRKRKEALKEAVAKLREKGKPIVKQPPPEAEAEAE